MNWYRTSHESEDPKPVSLRFISYEDIFILKNIHASTEIWKNKTFIRPDSGNENPKIKVSQRNMETKKVSGTQSKKYRKVLSVYLESRKTKRILLG